MQKTKNENTRIKKSENEDQRMKKSENEKFANENLRKNNI